MIWWTYIISGAVVGLICALISARLRKKDRERIEELENENRMHRKEAIGFANELRSERRRCELLQGAKEAAEELKKQHQTELEAWQIKYFIALKENIKLTEQMRCRDE